MGGPHAEASVWVRVALGTRRVMGILWVADGVCGLCALHESYHRLDGAELMNRNFAPLHSTLAVLEQATQ